MNTKLGGKRALVTGGNSGIGAGAGARRIHQTGSIPQGRPRRRSAATDRGSAPDSEDRFTSFTLAFRAKEPRPPGWHVLRVETVAPARLQWSTGGWATVHDTETRDTGQGLNMADLPTAKLVTGREIDFTFYWPQSDRWEGNNFSVRVGAPEPTAARAVES